MQNDFEIVDHQIEDDADVRAAVRIRRKPMGLDEARIGEPFFQRAQDRIETLDVADLQDTVCRRATGLVQRLKGVRGHRLFHQKMFAALQ